MSKQMVLVARTNKIGSDSECGLGITEDEWVWVIEFKKVE